jgi:drug/metabolite transporter (DMT)-like permease
VGVLLGLAAALNWGVADYMARFATRRIGSLRSLMFMQAVGFCALSIVMAATGHWTRFFPAFAWAPWIWILLAGILSAFSTLALYRSFEVGVLALVSPIAASYPALTVVLSLATGERLTPAHGFGIAAVILGVILAALVLPSPNGASNASASAPAADSAQSRHHLLRGVPYALAAALGFGVNYWIIGFRVMPVFSGFGSVWVIRLITFLVLAMLLRPLGETMALPRGSTAWLIFFIGLTDTAGFVANNLAFKQEEIAIATVLASLYGVVTLFFAAAFLRERLGRTQWLGVALIFLGVALVSV